GELGARHDVRPFASGANSARANSGWRIASRERIAAALVVPIPHSPFAIRYSLVSWPLVRAKEQPPQPLAEIAPIILAHGLVADRGGDLANARFKRRAPLGRREACGFGLAHPQHVGERTRGRQHRVDRLAAA